MDAIGYASLTNDIEADDGLPLAEQETAIRAWCEANGATLVGVERDANVGDVASVPNRLGFGNVLAACRDKRAQTVVVARLDRLSPDIVLQEQLIADVERFGGALISVAAEPIDEARALIRQVLHAVAPHESALRDLWVRQRLPRGDRTTLRARRATARHHLAHPRAPDVGRAL